MRRDTLAALITVLGIMGSFVLSSYFVGRYIESGTLVIGIAILLSCAWVGYMQKFIVNEADKAPEKAKTVEEDPFLVFELIDKAEREKYPENVRYITLKDIRKKAEEKRVEIYRSAKSFDEEKELIDLAVKIFSNRDSFEKAPSYVVKAALKLTGYDEEIVGPLYEMLYKEITRVYNVLIP